jgi:hypothetical protein
MNRGHIAHKDRGPRGPRGYQGAPGAPGAPAAANIFRVVETGTTLTIEDGYSVVTAVYMAVEGTGVLAIEGDGVLMVAG